jgi:ribosomal protein L40E
MVFCPKCHTQLVDDAKFCHRCGSNVDIPLALCTSCQKLNPADATFCYGCVNPTQALELLPPQYLTLKSRYAFHSPMVLEENIKNLFFEELKRYAGWIAPNLVDDYLRQVYTKGFTQTIDLRSKQLSEEFSDMYAKLATPSVFKLERTLESAVSGLALYHIIYNCKDINPFPIPEKILRYEKAVRGTVDTHQMIFDFLDFDNEKERVYTDFIKMPAETLENASKNFLFAARGEFIFFISDQSTFTKPKGKEGFAMTEFALYWKAPMDKNQKVYFHHLARLEKEKDWIKINNRFFNINPSINTKMLLLLDKLKNIYAG